MILILTPRFVRSKLDQSSVNPIGFCNQLGYRKVRRVRSRSRLDIDAIRPFRKTNIDFMERIG